MCARAQKTLNCPTKTKTKWLKNTTDETDRHFNKATGGGKRHPNQEKKEANLEPQRGTGRRKKRQGEKLPKNTADQTATGERQEKHRGKMTKKRGK